MTAFHLAISHDLHTYHTYQILVFGLQLNYHNAKISALCIESARASGSKSQSATAAVSLDCRPMSLTSDSVQNVG